MSGGTQFCVPPLVYITRRFGCEQGLSLLCDGGGDTLRQMRDGCDAGLSSARTPTARSNALLEVK